MLILSIYLYYPYHMLTLVASPNNWYQGFYSSVSFVDCFSSSFWMVLDRCAIELDLDSYQQRNFDNSFLIFF